MTKQKYLETPTAIDGSKLWDEILKAIVSVMPSQLFPLFKEVYGREYPHMREEVDQMMDHAIKLPSEFWDEYKIELADKNAELENKQTEIDTVKAEIAARDSEIASSNAEWQHRLAQKGAEIQRLQQLIDKLTYRKLFSRQFQIHRIIHCYGSSVVRYGMVNPFK